MCILSYRDLTQKGCLCNGRFDNTIIIGVGTMGALGAGAPPLFS